MSARASPRPWRLWRRRACVCTLRTGNRSRIYAARDAGDDDLAVTASAPDARRYGSADLATERLLLVTAPGFATRAKGRVMDAVLLAALPCLACGATLPLVRPFLAAVFDASPEMQAGRHRPGPAHPAAADHHRGRLDGAAGLSLSAEALAGGVIADVPTPRPGPDNRLNLAWNRGSVRHSRIVRDRILTALAARGS